MEPTPYCAPPEASVARSTSRRRSVITCALEELVPQVGRRCHGPGFGTLSRASQRQNRAFSKLMLERGVAHTFPPIDLKREGTAFPNANFEEAFVTTEEEASKTASGTRALVINFLTVVLLQYRNRTAHHYTNARSKRVNALTSTIHGRTNRHRTHPPTHLQADDQYEMQSYP